jgi:catechol 2,3-dioxygenase-like lactoylglutathione lyase family enzyme
VNARDPIVLGHINIRTGRMEETLAFYEAVLGFRRGAAATNPDPAQNMWLFDDRGIAAVHVNAFRADETVPEVNRSCLDHVAFNCPDRAGMAERLAAMGIAYRESPTRLPGMVQFNLLDPNGVRVELTFGHALAHGTPVA